MMQIVGPGLLGGITFGDWLALLRANNFAIEPRYWLRAAVISMRSVINSSRWQLRRALDVEELVKPPIESPIFILGVWRSGTTHLQNLLALDPRFATPNWLDVSYPHSCEADSRPSRLESFFVPRARLQDNMRFGFDMPAEDEFALCTSGQISPMLSWVFPKRAGFYDRYLTLQKLSPDELARWKAEFVNFVQKLASKYEKPLILKSPPHTARIRYLLELFPAARFVHIHRNPYAVFQSTRHLYKELAQFASLQNVAPDFDEQAIRQYKELFEAFFDQRSLIPRDRIVELRFEDVEQDPVGQLRIVYEHLDLPEFGSIEEAVRNYAASLADYRKNSYPDIAPEMRSRLAREWRRCFDEWGYPV